MNILELIIKLFVNPFGRLRSGWRFFIYIISFSFIIASASVILGVAFAVILGRENAAKFFDGGAGFFVNGILMLIVATLIGWACGFFLEGLPFKAFGWGLHKGWLKDFIVGSLVGIFSLLIGVAIIFLFGGYHFSFNNAVPTASIAKTVFISLFFFIVAAAAEEAVFRGYGLQTMTRSNIAWGWFALLLLSISFAGVHMNNPNVSPLFTFTNTALAGIWLSAAYLKTRSLWFPLGVHWAWNWMMAAILGIPVSGITAMTPSPLLKVEISGPSWLSGGSYGVEGGIACTAAVLISTIAIWLLPIAKPTEEMYALTSKENPNVKTTPYNEIEETI